MLFGDKQKQNIEAVRDLFARAHDYIAQASHPGHMGMKVAEVLNFLKFHYEDFKLRGEAMAKQIEGEAKAELSNRMSVHASVPIQQEVMNSSSANLSAESDVASSNLAASLSNAAASAADAAELARAKAIAQRLGITNLTDDSYDVPAYMRRQQERQL